MAKYSTKRALIASVLVLALCFTSLIGTTFAWFTDSATSGGNVIKSGKLDVELYWAEGDEDPANAAWVNAEDGAIFNNDKWEPGYVEAKHLKISNVGTLALKYQLAIIPTGEVSELAEVINVYLYQTEGTLENAALIADRTAVDESMYVGTLADVISSGIVQGSLAADTDYTTTIVLKMQETAGNEYQDLSIGDDFTIRVLATQLTAESDSFNDQYDKDAWMSGMAVYTAEDLQAAINAGENVTLMDDIELTESIVIPASAASTFSLRAAAPAQVINLNGKTINNVNGYVIENQGNIVITGNGTMSGLGCIRSTAGSITVENGNFYASSRYQDSNYQHTLKAENTNVVVNGGNFDATVNGQTNAMIGVAENAVVTINGGTFKNVEGELPTFAPYLFNYEKNGMVIINNGTFYGGWRFNGETATTNIYGGTFTVGFDGSSFNASSTHVLTVYSGTFVSQTNAKLTDKLADVVAEGYAVANNNGIYTVLQGDTVVTNSEELVAAILNGETNIALADGNYVMPDGWTGAHNTYNQSGYDDGLAGVALSGKTLTLNGSRNVVIDAKGIDSRDQNFTNANLTFNGVTVNFGTANYMGFANVAALTYNNCAINGLQFCFGNDGVYTFTDCELNSNGAEHSVWTWSGDKTVSFTGCDFTYADRAVNCYGENGTTNVSFTDCTFTKVEGKEITGAIETNSSALTKLNLTVENCTVNEGDLWWVSVWDSKNGANTTVNGKQYVADGLLKDLDNPVYYVSNANGLATLNAMMADKTAGRDTVVNLTSDIDFAGKVWTTVDSHADTAFEIAEINGNGHTLYNLTVNGQAMFRRFAGAGEVVVKDITFDGANVNSNGTINTSILTAQSYQNVTLDNVDVKNSTISGGYKVAPLIATVYNESSTTVTATLKNCDVENVVVKATSYDFCTAGMVAFVYADDNDKIEFESCTVTDVKLVAPNDSYKAHAAIYTTDSASLYDEADGVTVTNVTFEALE